MESAKISVNLASVYPSSAPTDEGWNDAYIREYDTEYILGWALPDVERFCYL